MILSPLPSARSISAAPAIELCVCRVLSADPDHLTECRIRWGIGILSPGMPVYRCRVAGIPCSRVLNLGKAFLA
jgi:hypothetical protein